VAAREFEIGVCYGPVSHDGVQAERLATGELICVLPRDHPLARKKTLTATDPAGECLISCDAQDILRGKVDRLFAAANQVPRFAVQVGQSITAIRLAQLGVGMAIAEPFYFAAMRPPGLVGRPLRRGAGRAGSSRCSRGS